MKISREREIKIEERSVMKEGVYVHDTREEGKKGRTGKAREGVESNINKSEEEGIEREREREREKSGENFLATNEEVLSRCIVRSFQ